METEAKSEVFYAGAVERIRSCMIGLAVLLSVAAWAWFGWQPWDSFWDVALHTSIFIG